MTPLTGTQEGVPRGRSMAPDLPPPPRRSSDTYPKHGLESPRTTDRRRRLRIAPVRAATA